MACLLPGACWHLDTTVLGAAQCVWVSMVAGSSQRMCRHAAARNRTAASLHTSVWQSTPPLPPYHLLQPAIARSSVQRSQRQQQARQRRQRCPLRCWSSCLTKRCNAPSKWLQQMTTAQHRLGSRRRTRPAAPPAPPAGAAAPGTAGAATPGAAAAAAAASTHVRRAPRCTPTPTACTPGRVRSRWRPWQCRLSILEVGGWLAVWLGGWLSGWVAGWLGRSVGRWLAGWLATWVGGCLAAWLPGCVC